MSGATKDRTPEPAGIEARGVSKRFDAVLALDEVSLTATPGRVTCLLGDNGAGKSTLIRVLAGVHPPTSGEVLLEGQPVTFDSPRDALDHGIATVHQDLGVVPLMSVWRNFVLGQEPTRGRGPLRRLDTDAARRTALDEIARVGVRLDDPDRPVGTLSGGERQSVAIARALHRGARVLILDEPTAALGVRQSATVLETIRRAADRDVAVLLVTHNPRHALEVGDAFVVLRQGRVAAAFGKDDASVEVLGAMMSG